MTVTGRALLVPPAITAGKNSFEGVNQLLAAAVDPRNNRRLSLWRRQLAPQSKKL